jgi:RNA polymerase sigma-32 factor
MTRPQPLNPILKTAFVEPVINREEEEELCRRWQQNADQAARRELARRTTRFVIRTARQLERYNMPIDDLISEGMIGLLRAVDLYNAEYQVRFMTYADYWVRAAMVTRIMKSRSLVSSSQGASKSRYFFRLRRELAKARALLGNNELATAAAAKALGLSEARVSKIEHELEAGDLSLTCPAPSSRARSIEDVLFDERDSAASFEHSEALQRLLPCVESALAHLSPRQVIIVRRRYLQDDSLTLSQLATEFGISRERVRQLEAAALTKLRQLVLRNSAAAREEIASAA